MIGKRSMGLPGLAMLSGAALAAPAFADPAPDYSVNLFGDLGGFREAFAKVGGTLNVTETSEAFANPYGGLARGADYDGLTIMTIQVDTKPGLHWEGGQFNASVVNLHGDNFSPRYIGALQTISGVAGDSGTRLFEVWYDQKLGDNFDLKIGQQSLDFEFAQHPSAGYFVNALAGWPIQWGLDMPAGGPAFPLATLGVRGKYTSGAVMLLGGVFSGSPVDASTNPDPQRVDRYGLSFPVRGALVIGEAQYAINQGEGEYAGVYKVGAWWDSLSFADLRYNRAGVPLADPAADPAPASRRGDFGLYALGEQTVWRGSEKERTLSLFLRATLAPQSDRNLSTFGLDGGLALRDPFAGRKDDTFVLGFGWQHLSAAAVGASLDAAAFSPGVYVPRRGDETVFEANYLYQATAWMQVQPNVQYVHNPGGGLLDPQNPARKVGDALVGGLRVNITF